MLTNASKCYMGIPIELKDKEMITFNRSFICQSERSTFHPWRISKRNRLEKQDGIIMPAKKVLVVSGKRKTAVARAVVKQGVGKVRINMTPVEIYEPDIARAKIMEPLLEAGGDIWQQLDMDVQTSGGGYMGQAEAARMAVANALLKWTKSTHLRTVFSEYDRTMIVGDSRAKETKKVGGAGARSKEQKSYR